MWSYKHDHSRKKRQTCNENEEEEKDGKLDSARHYECVLLVLLVRMLLKYMFHRPGVLKKVLLRYAKGCHTGKGLDKKCQ